MAGHDEGAGQHRFAAPVPGAGVQIRVGPAHMALPQLPQTEIARDAQFVPEELQHNAAMVPVGIEARRARLGADGGPLPRKAAPPPPPPPGEAVIFQDGGARRATQDELLERLRMGVPPQRAVLQAPLIERAREQNDQVPLIEEV